MKRFLPALLSLALVICFFPIHAHAEDNSGNYDNPNVIIGRYEQDLHSTFNGTLGIDWIPLDVSEDGSKVLLMTYCALDVQNYSDNNSDDIWERSSIRTWLNTTFFDTAFTEAEKAVILTTTVKNDASQNNSDWDTASSGSNDTDDKVFLLSAAEYQYYFDDNEKWDYTEYAKDAGNKIRSTGAIWLRSPGKKAGQACIISGGKLNSQAVDKPSGVCPAIWVDFSADWSEFPYQRFTKAIDLEESGDFLGAFPIFDELGTYANGYWFAGICLARNALECEDAEERIHLLEEFQVYSSEKSLMISADSAEPLFNKVLAPLYDAYYTAAVTAQETGNYKRAIELYTRLGNYDDSMDRLVQCFDAAHVNYAYFDVMPVNAGNKGGYASTDIVDAKDPHSGWKLGRFIIAGFTEERSDGVFLKTLGDDVILLFDLDQDIYELNGNSKLTIAPDKEAKDVFFNYSESGTSFGKGALLIQHEDFRHNKTPISPYVNYLEASDSGLANTRVEINEEGTYQISLDYLVKSGGIGGKTNGYRISFAFDVRNGDVVAFLRDAKTTSELQDYSITANGFTVDLGDSHSVDINITRYDINLNGTALDVRENAPASGGEAFTLKGYYVVEMTNSKTGKTVAKNIFVGNQSDLREFMQIEPNLGQFVK